MVIFLMACALFTPLAASDAMAVGGSGETCYSGNMCNPGLMCDSNNICIVDPNGSTLTPMGDVLCMILDWIMGNLGKGLATLAVIMLGVGAMLGKTSWGLALTVAVGIAVMFNAPNLIMLLGITVPGC